MLYPHLPRLYRAHPRLTRAAAVLCRLLPRGFMAAYPVLIGALWLQRGHLPWPQLLAPALTLGLTGLLRRCLDRPRPFEVYGFPPLLPHGPGGSLPSRHSASAAAIALAAFSLSPWLGAALVLLALAVGLTRVAAGLHFIRDVAVGYLLALLCAPVPFLFYG